MKYEQLLLNQLSEEAAEVSQRCSKAIRFGLIEKQPGQDLTNIYRLAEELKDCIAVISLLDKLPNVESLVELLDMSDDELNSRQEKIIKYLRYSQELGILDGGELPCRPQ
jgi:hypothetical protein